MTPRIELARGDITQEKVDAIVNAANSRLAGGGGVDGAIHATGGAAIMDELRHIRSQQGGCPTGSAVHTTAGKLGARYVFHAVGPIWDPNEALESDRLLASAYSACMDLARELAIGSIAFPSISTGVYCFPIQRAAPIALQTVAQRAAETRLERIRFVLFSEADLAVYRSTWSKMARDR